MGCDNYRMRCYCQGDGCSRAQRDGLFGVMVQKVWRKFFTSDKSKDC